MNLINLTKYLRSHAKSNFPIILSCAAGIGVVATAVLASKATVEAVDLIRAEERIKGIAVEPKQRIIERTKLVWKLYLPAGASAASTIICIVGANRIEAKKTLAAQTAFAVSQRAYSEYRDKIVQEFGENKDRSIRDSIAEDRVKRGPAQEVIIGGSGSVLCCEMFTMRYFNCDIEQLKRAQNEINHKVLAHDYATFDDFYYLIGLGRTTESNQMGWKSSRLMELEFTSVLTEEGTPCLAFEYNYYVVL